MSRLSVVFAGLCVAGLFSVAFAQDACNKVTKGELAGVPYNFRQAELTPGVRDWDVIVPKPANCERIIGVVSTACDNDMVPSQWIEGLEPGTVHIHRNGDLLQTGLVQLTVFCQP